MKTKLMNLRLIITAAALLTAAAALAACGSNGDATAMGGSDTVSVQSIGGSGDVLVDSSGAALYTPAQEAGGKILCTGECTGIWMPLTTANGGAPTGSDQIASDLGTVKRGGGTTQVTFKGGPLYTFTEDSPGKVTGDGFKDSFAGQDFTWHVVTPSGASDASSPAGGSGGSGYRY
jgi:predicted lipoprotein with Yx(FWY)xxD motif